MEKYDNNIKEIELNDRDTIKNVEKTIDLIEYLSFKETEIGVREASRILDISKSTMQRIFNSLLAKQIVYFNEKTQSYGLDLGVLRLVLPFLENNVLKMVSEKYMEKLRDELGETIGLHIRVNDKQILVQQFESQEELRWSIAVGKPYPINVGASGKTLLAFLAPDVYNKISANFSAMTNHSLTGEHLLDDLNKIREDGFAISKEEISIGEMGIAVPIFKKGEILASLSVYGPVARLNQKNIGYLVQRLIETSTLISDQLG